MARKISNFTFKLKCSLCPCIYSTFMKVWWGRRIWALQTRVFVEETNCPGSNLAYTAFQVCVSGQNTELLWASFSTLKVGTIIAFTSECCCENDGRLCVKCLTWYLACRKRSIDRNTTKKKEGKKEMGLWSQSSVVLNPGSATPWQLFRVILDVTVRIQRESTWRLLDGCLTQSQGPTPATCYLGP